MEEEEIKKIATLREILENKILKLENELESSKVLLNFINDFLSEKSFRKLGEIAQPKKTLIKPKIPMKEVPLKTASGELLATLYSQNKILKIIIAKDKNFGESIPPFKTFLIERILMKMSEKDREAVNKGIMLPDEILNFEIMKEGDLIREIIINNINSERKREVKSAARWTFEKMYEKILKSN